uniref:hypothetical protein n=1 Tax=Gemmiger sp. TaxID=2049027 RepID=UPI0025C00EA3
MSKKKKRSTPAAAPAEPAKAEHTKPEEPAVSSTARWMGALCYLSILILGNTAQFPPCGLSTAPAA